jgi:hypothetical protein
LSYVLHRHSQTVTLQRRVSPLKLLGRISANNQQHVLQTKLSERPSQLTSPREAAPNSQPSPVRP